MNYLIKLKKLKFTTLIGLTLTIIAISIWLFSVTQIQSNELILSNQNVRVEEVWRAEGALQWWNNTYSTIIAPATSILTLIGITTILSPKLLHSFKQKNTFNKFEKELQKACKV
jgi:hypothetical protein